MLQFLRKTHAYILAFPLVLGFLGVASNQVVLVANHDTFPVRISEIKLDILQTPEEGQPENIPISGGATLVGDTVVLPDGKIMLDKVHCVMTDSTHLNWLADEFDLGSIYSIGDGFIGLGEWLWTFAPFVWGALVVRDLNE